MNELLPLFEDSQGCYQQDDPIVLFVLALDAQWPLVHLLDLHRLLAQIWVVGFVHELESNQLLLTMWVRHCRPQVRHCHALELQQMLVVV